MSERHWQRPALLTKVGTARPAAPAEAGDGGRDGVSEVLVSAPPDVAHSALGNKLPAGCAHYTASAGGKTFHYSVKQSPVAGLGDEARALNVKAAGYSQVNVWSVVYRAGGFVGAVTIVGPDASQAGAKKLASQAYAHARQSLS